MTLDPILPPDVATDEELYERSIEIRTLTRTAEALVEISPEAARAVRDSARTLAKVQLKQIEDRRKKTIRK